MLIKYSTFDGIKSKICNKLFFKNSDNGLIVQIYQDNEITDLIYAKQLIIVEGD